MADMKEYESAYMDLLEQAILLWNVQNAITTVHNFECVGWEMNGCDISNEKSHL